MGCMPRFPCSCLQSGPLHCMYSQPNRWIHPLFRSCLFMAAYWMTPEFPMAGVALLHMHWFPLHVNGRPRKWQSIWWTPASVAGSWQASGACIHKMVCDLLFCEGVGRAGDLCRMLLCGWHCWHAWWSFCSLASHQWSDGEYDCWQLVASWYDCKWTNVDRLQSSHLVTVILYAFQAWWALVVRLLWQWSSLPAAVYCLNDIWDFIYVPTRWLERVKETDVSGALKSVPHSGAPEPVPQVPWPWGLCRETKSSFPICWGVLALPEHQPKPCLSMDLVMDLLHWQAGFFVHMM